MTDTSAPAPDISVVLPAYNTERYLERAVRSALDQQGVALEVVIVDDASSDGTAAVAARLAAEDPRVTLAPNPVNRGCGGSRNAGALAARGRWIALLDADDAFAPGRLRRLLDIAEREDLDAVADLLLLYDLTAQELGDTQLEADGRFEVLTPRSLLDSAVNPDAKLNYGLLKPLYRRELVVQGRWLYPEHARHGADFLGFLDTLVAGLRYGLLHEAHYVFSTRIGEKSGAWSSGSVTPVNYRAIAANTHEWIEKYRREAPDIPGLPLEELLAMLETRAEACLKMNRNYGWRTFWTRAWPRHLAWLRSDPRNPPLLARMAVERLLGGRWLHRFGLRRPEAPR
ncbi:MAG: glycosyltransferase family 2 protein [Pseudomonadota bacterium]